MPIDSRGAKKKQISLLKSQCKIINGRKGVNLCKFLLLLTIKKTCHFQYQISLKMCDQDAFGMRSRGINSTTKNTKQQKQQIRNGHKHHAKTIQSWQTVWESGGAVGQKMALTCICVPSIKCEFMPFHVINLQFFFGRHVCSLVYFTFSIIKYTLQPV